MLLESLKNWVNNALKDKFDERSRLQLERSLIEHYTGWSRGQQQIRFNEKLDSDVVLKVQEGVELLLNDMPIDYVIGISYFYGYPFEVNKNVLIPRSETEELVQLILEREKDISCKILDIGTGSGCIPITLALEANYSSIAACDISLAALEVAKGNAEKLGAKIHFFQCDILNETPNKKYDIIVSNPPYVKKEEMDSLDKNVRDYEPRIALTPEDDALLFYKVMIEKKKELLENGGRMYWEIHEELGQETKRLMVDGGFTEVNLLEDMFGRDRFVFGTLQY